jgi:methionyl-tRNA formyltransferase
MRIALLTLEAGANARAVRRFLAAHKGNVALVGLSNPYRAASGGAVGQTIRRVRRSGPRVLPYLVLNFVLPRLVAKLRRPAPGDIDRTPLAAAAAARGIPSVTIEDVNGEAFHAALAASGAELILTFHFDQILSAETIAAVPHGGINVHPSLLPLHRGPTPTIHALLDDPVRLGVSVHRLVPKIDAGALLAQSAMADEPGLTALGAAARLHEAALPLLDRVLAEIEAGTAVDTPFEALPYRRSPTPDQYAALARKGRSAAGWRDLRAALGR